jgi:hypothetical protein
MSTLQKTVKWIYYVFTAIVVLGVFMLAYEGDLDIWSLLFGTITVSAAWLIFSLSK